VPEVWSGFLKKTGVLTPKRVIRLFRMQQMADQIMQASSIDWRELANKLGYFEQAHCIRDFKSFTGKTPSAFLKNELITETFKKRVLKAAPLN
jgi:AraC-like DNA-binding protein